MATKYGARLKKRHQAPPPGGLPVASPSLQNHILTLSLPIRNNVRNHQYRRSSHPQTSLYPVQVTPRAIIAMATLNRQPIMGMGTAHLCLAEVPALHTLPTHPPPPNISSYSFSISIYSKPNNNHHCSNKCNTLRQPPDPAMVGHQISNGRQNPNVSKRTP
jgi:hypothetical protein